MDHEQVISEVVEWAEADENIRLAVLVGSIGRDDTDVDDLSDLDVQLYVSGPERLLAEPSWPRRFGEALVVEDLPNPGWYPTRLAYYVDGKIDFIISPSSDIGVDTYDEPFRVLLDKDDAAERLPLVLADHALPTEFDTRYLGKHLDRWMDADVRDELDGCWGAFAVPDARAALVATVELYDRLCLRAAVTLGLGQPPIAPPREEVHRVLGFGHRPGPAERPRPP